MSRRDISVDREQLGETSQPTGMIITNLRGGLGNQMFQYACGLALAADCNLPVRISTDMLQLAAKPRAPEIEEVFKVKAERANGMDLARLLGRMRSRPRARLLLEKPWFAWARGDRFWVEFDRPEMEALRLVSVEGAYLHGYWQSERYFIRHEKLVRTALRFSRPLSGANAEVAERIKAWPSVSMHIRRGDYLTNDHTRAVHGLCSVDYYVAAVKRMQKLEPGLRIMAFSDDPGWVADALQPRIPQMTIVSHNTGSQSFEDMRLMSLCHHHIIANSSFSWWAAWLNPRPDKVVIAPRRWFANGRDASDLVPSSWERL